MPSSIAGQFLCQDSPKIAAREGLHGQFFWRKGSPGTTFVTSYNVVQADGGWETEYMPLRYAHQVGATGGGATITEEDEPSP